MSSVERRSVLLLLAVVLLVPATWLALGWRWNLLVGGNDLSLLLLPAMQRLLAVHGDFDAFLYDASWLGGSKLRDLLGALPLHRVLGALSERTRRNNSIRYQTGPGPTVLQAELGAPRRGLCPLTVSMNFVDDFVVLGREGEQWLPLRTFPACGALLGIPVPADVSQIKVVFAPYRPGYALVGLAFGAILLASLLVHAHRVNGRSA